MARVHPIAHDIVALAEQQRQQVLPSSRWRLRIAAMIQYTDENEDEFAEHCAVVYRLGRTRGGAVVSCLDSRECTAQNNALQDTPCCELTRAACTLMAADAVAWMRDHGHALSDNTTEVTMNFKLEHESDYDWEKEIAVAFAPLQTRQERNDALTAAVMLGIETCLGMYESLRFDIVGL